MAKHIKIIAIKNYNDLELKKLIVVGTIIETTEDRAYKICQAGLAKIYSILTY
jgi:hypothetical protein